MLVRAKKIGLPQPSRKKRGLLSQVNRVHQNDTSADNKAHTTDRLRGGGGQAW